MSFRCPVEDQKFTLTHAAGIGDLMEDAEMVDAVLDAAAALAEGELAPLNRVGDTAKARWDNGRVIMPQGFKAAYDAFVEGGWMTLSAPEHWGGQGLPLVLSAAMMDSLNGANMGFTLCPMLSVGAIEALEQHGSDELKERYLPKIEIGRAHV